MINNEFGDVLVIDESNFLENFDKLISVIKNSSEYQKLADCTQMVFDKKGNAKVMNRQTHTELVAKLASNLARKMGFSEFDQKLAELIGICHDLGHTAFGHDGENRINKTLKYHNLSAKDLNNAYATTANVPELLLEGEYDELEHSFEHHAHSRRVLRKILKDNNIIIKEPLLSKIEWGILCHSESRTPNEKVTDILWTFTRYADKFYAFTDTLDTMRSENYIPGDILHRIQAHEIEEEKKPLEERKSYFKDKTSKDSEPLKLEQSDFDEFSAILEIFDQNGLEFFISQYINEAKIIEEDNYFYIDTKTNIGRQMRILQGVMKYMRENGLVGKEEELANAMIDEIIAYRIAHPREGVLEEKDKVLDACLFISMATDTELRDFYKFMAHDVEWCRYFDEKMKNNVEFETVIQQDEREYIRKNPDIILNYYFNTEIDKVKDSSIRVSLNGKLMDYRKKPTLRKRRELIELIEIAQSGGNPFTMDR